jgi:transposase
MLVRHFVREGMPVAGVARRFGVCRQTVYNHMRREGPYEKPRKARESKLDPFKDYIRGRLERFDIPATVLFREIQARGYLGQQTILGDFVRFLKREKVLRLTERFETEPGLQAQADFAECGTIIVDGRPRKFYLFDFVLGFSRMMWGRFVISMKQHELMDCLKGAFDVLGITRELLVDNMKQVVDRHDPLTGTVKFNRAFLDFAEHYGFVPIAAPPYWPRVKGKVERNIDYVKRCFLSGRSFVDLSDLNRQFALWQDTVANVRVHGTTGRQPVELYREEEERRLDPARGIPAYDTRPVEIRKVGTDSHIRYGGVFYSVDPSAVGKAVIVKSDCERVGCRFEVYLSERLVGAHWRRPGGAPRVTLAEHAVRIRALTRGKLHPGRVRAANFEQVCGDKAAVLCPIPVPVVETRSLDLYEGLLGGES